MTATASKSDFWRFLQRLVDIDVHVPTEDDPPWNELGKLYQIDKDTYWYFLELLPPRWIDGDWFAFGEGAGTFCIYFRTAECYFVRQLTDEETRIFCTLSGTSRCT